MYLWHLSCCCVCHSKASWSLETITAPDLLQFTDTHSLRDEPERELYFLRYSVAWGFLVIPDLGSNSHAAKNWDGRKKVHVEHVGRDLIVRILETR
jgi:hypothetical protein